MFSDSYDVYYKHAQRLNFLSCLQGRPTDPLRPLLVKFPVKQVINWKFRGLEESGSVLH